MPKTPSKNNTATPKKSTSSYETGEELPSRLSQLSIVPAFSMDFKLPFVHYSYNEGLDQMIKVEVLVPILPKEYFIPDLRNDGQTLDILIQVPFKFIDEERVLDSNSDKKDFNVNTYQAQAYKDMCEGIMAKFGKTNSIFGKPMVIDLPFVCEQRIVEWEVQAYPNDLGTLTDDLGGQQFHAVLSVILRKLKTKRKTTGGFRVIGA